MAEARRPACELWIRPGDAGLRLNFPGGAQSWSGVRIRLRGPLASVDGIDANGARRCLHWWPDTLPGHERRRLRLAAAGLGSAPASASPLVF